MKKNDAWNIRRLVDELFVPVTQHIILKIVGFLLPSIAAAAVDLKEYWFMHDNHSCLTTNLTSFNLLVSWRENHIEMRKFSSRIGEFCHLRRHS